MAVKWYTVRKNGVAKYWPPAYIITKLPIKVLEYQDFKTKDHKTNQPPPPHQKNAIKLSLQFLELFVLNKIF